MGRLGFQSYPIPLVVFAKQHFDFILLLENKPLSTDTGVYSYIIVCASREVKIHCKLNAIFMCTCSIHPILFLSFKAIICVQVNHKKVLQSGNL